MPASRERLTALLRPVITRAGCDLEELAVVPAGRRQVVRVSVDRDGGVSLDDVADVSRVLSEALDDIDVREPDLLGGAYVLEVSSPGVDRPLTAARHWRRAVGRLVVAELADGTSVTGRVVAADEATVSLDVDGTQRPLALGDLFRGVMQLEFSRPAGTADDVEDEEEVL